MDVENVTTITLTGRDTRLAMTNSGLRVELPLGTVAVVIRVAQDVGDDEGDAAKSKAAAPR